MEKKKDSGIKAPCGLCPGTKGKKSQSTQTKGWIKARKEVLRRDKSRHAINKELPAAGRPAAGRPLHPAPQRYGHAEFDKVKSHLPENAAVSPRGTEMNFSSASFYFSPKLKALSCDTRRAVCLRSFLLSPFFFHSFTSATSVLPSFHPNFLISLSFLNFSSFLEVSFPLTIVLSFFFPSLSLSTPSSHKRFLFYLLLFFHISLFFLFTSFLHPCSLSPLICLWFKHTLFSCLLLSFSFLLPLFC